MQENRLCDKLMNMNLENTQAPNPVIDPAVNEYRKHLYDAMRSGQEQYDKYLLTLSSGGLAISLMMLKEVFGKAPLACPTILICSWALFCLCIILTIISFLTSQKCLRRLLERYEESIMTGDYTELRKTDPLEKLTNCLNYLSGVFFLFAIVTTVIFASINIKRGVLMSNEPVMDLKKGYAAPKPPLPLKINNGYTPPPPPTTSQQQQQAPPEKK